MKHTKHLYNFLRLMISFILIGSLTACNVDRLKRKDIVGTDFNHELAKEYKSLSEAEALQDDWKSANLFAKKGLMALNGKHVEPEKLTHWKEPNPERQELMQARELLLKLIDSDLRQNHPEHAARAQALFDCWVEQQSENWQTNDIAFCKHGFYHLTEHLKIGREFYNHKHTTPQPKIGLEHVKPHTLSHTVYFDFNKSDLTEDARKAIDEIVYFLKDDLQKEKNSIHLQLSGHADTVGDEKINDVISERRAHTVKNYLVKQGLDEHMIVTHAFGKKRLAVQTPDQTKEPLNRRVEIYINR